ncbi:RanBP1 domain-containing protein [Colletotrichum musicola]|uniref:RanBP1 domain-containing protein n=1 Tax=Colletotrichum musicola TaxID=2175873 RepID=A0A8H6UA61_9PEZI|nr:RanBP1 domain-containing protein [Colletotrichum musicola]
MDHRNSTPRARPSLKFANRSYQASPLNPNKRLGTPQTAPSQKVLNRDPMPSSNLNTSTISTAHNLFRSSSITASPAAKPFAPTLPESTMKKVFAPGATPASQKVYRENIAQATPRGLASKSNSADLFQMRIPSPPPELTGEALARDIPPELEAKGTVYADQYLSHLVPAEYDDLQRRQLFCVLDLRRLKYAANEIFAKKDWKLNIMNFAKEFEKSRSLIMLRYGLYEFKNVKPSDEMLKKWRAAHGLPDPEDETADASPSRQTTRSKRKAEEQLTPKDTALAAASPNKRRAFDQEEQPVSTPAAKSKRKASVTDEADENQPSKFQKSTSTPSATKNLFERIANNQGPASTPKATPKAPEAKPNPFAANGAPRSVFEALKPPQQGGNIFGYLSDASSAKNSGVEADGESETDSEDEPETQDAGQQSYEPSVAASGGAETPLAQPASNLFAKKPLFSSGLATGPSSTSSDARETTPGRSLFDRVSKGNDGQPLRADSSEPTPAAGKAPSVPEKESAPAAAPAPVNATWNPSSPIKFNAGAPAGNGLFGAAPASSGSSSIFGAKPSAAGSNIFGAPKQDKPADEQPKPAKRSAPDADAESDKENSSQPPAKSPFAGFSAGFQPKTSAEPKKEETAPKAAAPSFSFGAPALKADEAKPAAPASSLFGAQPKPESAATPAAEPAKPLFGAGSSAAPSPFQSNTLFGSKTPAPASSNLFGSSTKATEEPAASKAPEPAPAAATAPVFSFGGSKPAESTPLFGAPKSDAAPAASSAPLFGGSPMKQDGPPAKKAFNAPEPSAPSAPSGGMFNFGGSQSAAPSNPFGGSSAPQANGGSSAPPSFGSGGGSSFTFSAGGGQAFNNPFASNSSNGGSFESAPAQSGGSMFNFGGASSAPSGGSPFQFGGGSSSSAAPASSSPFQFGGAPAQPAAPANGSAPSGGSPFQFGGGAPAAPASSPFQFGGGAPAQPAAPAASAPTFSFGASNGTANSAAPAGQKPLFGASTSTPSATSTFQFGAKPAQPAAGMFGGLQPPAGASTTGTNSPFNFGGASSLATTPATGTPEPAAEPEKTAANGDGDDAEGKPHEQIKLTDGGPGEEDETVVHEVRAKVLKFTPAGEDKDSGDDQPKSKSPWSTKGIGPFRLLKHKTTGAVRMLLRAEPRGHVVLNRTVLPTEAYKADQKYVKLTTSNEAGNGLETWMVQVRTADLATQLAAALESNKSANAN